MDNNVKQISDVSVHVDFPMLPLSKDLMDHFSLMHEQGAGREQWVERSQSGVDYTDCGAEIAAMPLT